MWNALNSPFIVVAVVVLLLLLLRRGAAGTIAWVSTISNYTSAVLFNDDGVSRMPLLDFAIDQ